MYVNDPEKSQTFNQDDNDPEISQTFNINLDHLLNIYYQPQNQR